MKVPAVLAAALAASAFLAHPGAGKEPAAPCTATTVHYTATESGAPWIAAGRTFTGNVLSQWSITGDGRVNQSDGLVVYADVPATVLWEPRKPRRAGRALILTGRRVDAYGVFTDVLRRDSRGRFRSRLTIPAVGCWRLWLLSGRLSTTVTVQAVAAPAEPRCDATPVIRQDPPHPRFGRITWMQATPRTSGVAAIRFVSVVPGADSAVIYAGGRAPEGWNTKFLWWAPHPTGPLTLTGRRLDRPGRFVQRFGSASSDDGIVFPSIVEIPTAGCWAVTVEMGKAAGLVVFQAVVT